MHSGQQTERRSAIDLVEEDGVAVLRLQLYGDTDPLG